MLGGDEKYPGRGEKNARRVGRLCCEGKKECWEGRNVMGGREEYKLKGKAGKQRLKWLDRNSTYRSFVESNLYS